MESGHTSKLQSPKATMASAKLSEVLRQVENSKVTKRSEGIEQLRKWVDSDDAIPRISKSRSASWDKVFAALYANIDIEKEAFSAKARAKTNANTATIEKRLTETSALIRHICEKGAKDFSESVARKLVRNLKDKMRWNTATFLDPVVLDFVKSLKIILSHTPHMHTFTSPSPRRASDMDDDDDDLSDEEPEVQEQILPHESGWLELTSIAFNVVLDYPLNRRIEPEIPTDEMEVDGKDELEEVEDEDEDEGDEEDTRASPRKRSRSAGTHYPTAKLPQSPRTATRLSHDTREKREWIGLLSILLSTHRNPMFHNLLLTPQIMERVTHVLQSYSTDSSIHHELLPALSSILTRLCLSQSAAVKNFAVESWNSLVGLWGPKAKPFREHLIATLSILLPYYVLAQKRHDWGEGLERLYKVMEKEVGTGKGLSLSALRLEVDLRHFTDRGRPAFATPTFRAAPSFDQAQALTWATLELEADCIVKLYERSESFHPIVTPTPTQRESKRTKLENPLKDILSALLTHSSADAHIHRIQTIVFIIERHWSTLHWDLQQDVKRRLVDVMSAQNQNSTIQSWAFLAFAAIAYAESRSTTNEAETTGFAEDNVFSWEAIWASCMRRTNVPSVCRAACHAAESILVHAYQTQDLAAPLPISSNAILMEIEMLMKGLESQGPAFPCDSVCALLNRCLRVASQDSRLYRMRLEDVALAWLIESWRVDPTIKGDLPLYDIDDILRLLGTMCAYKKVPDLLVRVLLPPCPIVQTLEEQARTRAIRDFLLEARLPPFRPPPREHDADRIHETGQIPDSTHEADAPAREAKLSKFLNRCLVRLADAWAEKSKVPTAEAARRDMDIAVIALAFETLRKDNGIKRDRGVVKHALKLMRSVMDTLRVSRLTETELALILHALDPLLCSTDPSEQGFTQELFASIAPGAGIRSQLIRRLAYDSTVKRRAAKAARVAFQRMIWSDDDIDKDVEEIQRTLSSILDDMTEVAQDRRSGVDADFGGIREVRDVKRARQRAVQTCVCGLYTIPYMKTGQLTRASEFKRFLSDFVKNAQQRMDVVGVLVNGLQARMLHLGTNALSTLVADLDETVALYSARDNSDMQLLVIELLHATLPTWSSDRADSALIASVSALNEWLSRKLRRCDLDWNVRSRLTQYLAAHVEADRTQTTWSDATLEPRRFRVQPDRYLSWYYPRALLPWLVGDLDCRVSFQAASLIPRVLQLGAECHDLNETVQYVYECLGASRDRSLETLLATILAMGNMMITSTVRRRTYWNLLDSYFEAQSGNQRFIEAVLRGVLAQVAQRMGMSTATELFDIYASQIAYSMIKSGKDLNRLPPSMLGYRDRVQCIAAGFRAFAPFLIGEKESATFQSHCALLGKRPEDGIQECFGDVVGGIAAKKIDEGTSWTSSDLTRQVASAIIRQDDPAGPEGFTRMLRQNIDAVTVAVLRAMGELNLQAIANTLAKESIQEMADTFRRLTTYRENVPITEHDEMLPSYSCTTVICCLRWCNTEGGDAAADSSRSFHILHELFADVQRHPMVVDQRRKLNALCIWVAAYSQHFLDNAVMYVLLHGATILLGQYDLALDAQSILDWSLERYGENFSRERVEGRGSERSGDPRFLDILIRISSCANAYKSNASDTALSGLGERLAAWIDRKAALLCDEHGMTQQVLRVLPAWPYRPLDQRLLALHDELGPGDLSNVLASKRITSNKFALARRLRDYALADVYDPADFATSDFWHLKDHIPEIRQLDSEDIKAFATLLVSNQGRIDSFSDVALDLGNDDALKTADPRASVIAFLCNILRGEDGTRVYTAYRTLKLAMAVSRTDEEASHGALPGDIKKSNAITADQKADLRHLLAYPGVVRTRARSNLRAALKSVDFMHSASTFKHWMPALTVLLSDHLGQSEKFYAQLTEMLESDVQFAKDVFPVLLHTLLHWEQDHARSEGLRYRQSLSAYFTEILQSDAADLSCKEAIVKAVLHLRHYQPNHSPQSKTDKPDACGYDKWLSIDWLLLSRTALACRMYTTAFLFLELASEYNPASINDGATEEVLYEIYNHIDEPDGFYAIKSTDLQQFLLRRVHHEQQWDKAFRLHGAAMETAHAAPGDQLGLLRSFHAFGFNGLALNALPAFAEQTTTGLSYELGWRTGTWDLPDSAPQESTSASLYFALRAVHRERNSSLVEGAVQRALIRDMAQLRALGAESLSEIREVARRIMCLNQIAQWNHPDFQTVLAVRDTGAEQWRDLVKVNGGLHFQDLENIIATRISLLQSVRQKEEREQIGDLVSPWMQTLVSTERQCLVRLSEAARHAQELQVALNSITRAQRLGRMNTLDVEQEYANVLWLHQEKRLAIELLRGLLRRGNPLTAQTDATDMAVLRARMGTWTAEACLEKPNDILKNWFGPAAELLKQVNTGSPLKRAEVYRQCAVFAERQYYALFRSPEGRRWKVYSERKSKEISAITRAMNLHGSTQDEVGQHNKKLCNQLKAQYHSDREKMQEYVNALEAFLGQALDMYSRCLAVGDAHDDDGPIRLCSLWFANWDNRDVQEIVDTAFRRVPSRKLVFLSHQLSARLSKAEDPTLTNQTTLHKVLLRMCKEHPYHSLYQVFCLQANRGGSGGGGEGSRRQSARQTPAAEEPTATQAGRTATAGGLYDKLRKEDPRVSEMDRLCRAALEWATYPIASPDEVRKKYAWTDRDYKVPSRVSLFRLRDLRVPVMTAGTPLDPTSRYENCAWLARYEETFTTMGGLALPKVSKCFDCYGQKHKELFKGEGRDDLRQDAVMEQVFELCNRILRRDRETRRRRLAIRGYNVLPLTMQAGVLQFVTNTLPMQSWLRDAHSRYHPEDIPTRDMSTQHKTAQQETFKNPDNSLDVQGLTKWFTEMVTTRHRPVMRHFFREKHKEPTAWFATRLNYTRSVAVTSIIGHVLGLGDRHISNILLDQRNGEVIHIDLGIAFDQGRQLPVPERVPFRMTRDMVDGMGASGTQGVFQRCAEETLRVLRDGSDVIMTVLEVFKHDPLYQWTASETKLEKIQRDAGHEAEKSRRRGKGREKKGAVAEGDAYFREEGLGIDLESGTTAEYADRALNSVSRKLDGSLSVEFTVNELIAEATDMRNLATIYFGWQPHC
ncbi:hypothetical protein BD626DRAFT_567398 [Schizophyllum amplum]|uniref:Serine/threonine-protein kinase Tel1 n=1 Tax=Schizophyllum amplum TaxID=97359 RepID=A0A550CL03_9AGAR|nr:hypothetical protein BD626DRAFT_567398 [Auriculariopsis ampla]